MSGEIINMEDGQLSEIPNTFQCDERERIVNGLRSLAMAIEAGAKFNGKLVIDGGETKRWKCDDYGRSYQVPGEAKFHIVADLNIIF